MKIRTKLGAQEIPQEVPATQAQGHDSRFSAYTKKLKVVFESVTLAQGEGAEMGKQVNS